MIALALLVGVGAGLGALLVILGFRGTTSERAPRPVNQRDDRGGARRLAIAVGAGLVVALVTRWPVGGVLAGALAYSWHTLFGQKASSTAEVARIEAIASWTEMLRDTMSAASGLEQAITTTASLAPAPIRADVMSLALRIESREATLAQALPDLADALADPTADLVVAALVSAAERRARSLGELLGALAASAREDATMRMRIQAGRARVRTAARIVTFFTVAFAGFLVLLKRDFLAPYNTSHGQIVLAGAGVVFVIGFWWLTKMSTITSPERFLTGLRQRRGTALS